MSGDYKVRIGAEVGARLAAAPGAYKIPAESLDIHIVRDFLGPEDRDGLIAMIDAWRIPSQLLLPTGDPDYRTSESCNLDPFDPFVQSIEAKFTALTGIDPSHGETIQGQRYAAGQRFKTHHDFFMSDQPYWEEMDRTGGQRTWTAMVFLNAPDSGGATFFEKAGVRVTPRPGNLLIWNNLEPSGQPNFNSLHEGQEVTAGVKYIITKWYRERPWRYSDAAVY